MKIRFGPKAVHGKYGYSHGRVAHVVDGVAWLGRMPLSMHQMAHVRRRADTLDYVQAMLVQLRVMADAEHCDMLAYLIEMACIEAGDLLRGERPSVIGRDERNSSA